MVVQVLDVKLMVMVKASHKPTIAIFRVKREMAAAPVRSVGRLVPSSTALLLCDMQVPHSNPIMITYFCKDRFLGQVPSDDLPL